MMEIVSETPRRGIGVSDLLNSRRFLTWAYYGMLIALALTFLFPLLWMIGTSFKTGADALTSPGNPIPDEPTLQNYGVAMNILPSYFLNSSKLAVLNVVGVLVVCSLAGYAFARLDFWGRDALFLVVLASALVPSIVYLIPQYLIFKDIGWVDTHYPLWIPRVLTPIFGTFMMRQFFKSVPVELEEAARIDGASILRIYGQIMMPLAKPALATVAVFTFIESWNDLLGPLIFINSQDLQTLPVALAMFQGEFFSDNAGLMAAATITIVPVVGVFILAQKHFVQGIVMAGLKA